MSGTEDRFTRLLCAAVLLAVLGCGQQTQETKETQEAAQTPPSAQPPEEVWLALSQIVIQWEGAAKAPPEITRTQEDALKLASEISTQIRAGADFAELAKQHSDDKSREDGGTLGVFASTDMQPAIAAACMALAVGGVSDPVETKFGYHVVRRDSEVELAAARVILVAHAESEVVKLNLERTREEALARANEVLEKLRSGVDFADLVLEYSDSPTKKSGGDLGSFPRGVADPAVDAAIFALEVGEISEVTESPYGFHIFHRYE